MTDPTKLPRMTAAARSLKEAALFAWNKGHLREACRLYARADIAESRVRDLMWETMFPDEEVFGAIDIVGAMFKYGRPLG